MNSYCTDCGTILFPENRYCPKCGKKVIMGNPSNEIDDQTNNTKKSNSNESVEFREKQMSDLEFKSKIKEIESRKKKISYYKIFGVLSLFIITFLLVKQCAKPSLEVRTENNNVYAKSSILFNYWDDAKEDIDQIVFDLAHDYKNYDHIQLIVTLRGKNVYGKSVNVKLNPLELDKSDINTINDFDSFAYYQQIGGYGSVLLMQNGYYEPK